MSSGGDNVKQIDGTLTTALNADLALLATLQAAIAAAYADPQPSYTISGPTGSQNVDWNGYQNTLMTQLGDTQKRIMEWFKLKQTNLPYFNIRKGW